MTRTTRCEAFREQPLKATIQARAVSWAGHTFDLSRYRFSRCLHRYGQHVVHVGPTGILVAASTPLIWPRSLPITAAGPSISARLPCRQRLEQPRARPLGNCRPLASCECNIVGVLPSTSSLPRGQGNGTGRAPGGGFRLLRFPCFRSRCGGGCSRIAQPPQRPGVPRSPNTRTWLRQAFSHRQGSIVLTQCRFEHDDDGQPHPKLLISL